MGYEIGQTRHVAWQRLAGLALVGVLGVAACGNTEHDSNEPAMAGRDGGGSGSAAAGHAGQPQASGNAGSVGVGGSAGSAGAAGNGGEPSRFGLIVGDDACPPEAPPDIACPPGGATCVYRGVPAGLSELGTARCVCSGAGWACVSSDEKGNTECPQSRPSAETPCPPGGLTNCHYALFGQNAVASCSCSGSVGSGGAGGGSAGSNWGCGL